MPDLWKIILGFFFSFLLSTLLISQDIKTYNGPLNVDGDLYNARFEFYIANGDTIFNGPFEASKDVLAPEIGEPFEFLTVSGRFTSGKADGIWELREGELSASGIGEYRNFMYSFPVSGSEKLVTGQYRKGDKEGEWKVIDWNLMDSKVNDTLIEVNINYRNDQLYGDFTIENSTFRMAGQVDVDQFAEGVWTIVRKRNDGERPIEERWFFSDHKLTRKELYLDGNTYILNYDERSNREGAVEEETLIDERYFKIINMNSKVNKSPLWPRFEQDAPAEDLYTKGFRSTQNISSVFTSFTTSDKHLNVKTTLHKQPLTKDGSRDLKRIADNLHKANGQIDEILNDAQLSLARLSIPNVQFYFTLVDSIRSKYLNPIGAMVELERDGILDYINREAYYDQSISLQTEISLNASATASLPSTYTFEQIAMDESTTTISKIQSFTDGLNKEIEVINDSLEYYIVELRKEDALVIQESEIMEKFNSVMAFNDSLEYDAQNALAGFDIQTGISDFLESELSFYSQLESPMTRLQKGPALLECFETTEKLIETVQLSLQNYYSIRDAYTRQVFNSFTFTYMEETLKAPIFNSFEEVLLPGVFGNIESLTCENIHATEENFEILFKAMAEILDRDTNYEERKIKRVSSPINAANILKIELRFN